MLCGSFPVHRIYNAFTILYDHLLALAEPGRYKLPSAALFEHSASAGGTAVPRFTCQTSSQPREHRQRVKDIIEMMCNQLLDDQAMLKVLIQSLRTASSASIRCLPPPTLSG